MLKKMKYLIILILALFMLSCGSKKVVTQYKEVQKIDTIYKTVTKNVIKAFRDTINIESPCDSNGILKPFKHVIHTQKAKIILSNENGKINLKINLDSIVDARVNEFKSNYKVDTQIKEVLKVRYKIPIWAFISVAINGLLIFIIAKTRFS